MTKNVYFLNLLTFFTFYIIKSKITIKSNCDKILSIQNENIKIKRKTESDDITGRVIDHIFGIAIGGYKLLSENSSKETQQQGAMTALENAKQLFHTISEDTCRGKTTEATKIKQKLYEIENILESILQNQKAIQILREKAKSMLQDA
jgi:hypothetical protein